jgi:ribosomal protein L40E
MTGGNVVQVGFVCLQSGINSILTIQTIEGNKMEITALPAAALFRYVELYLSDPVAIQLLIPGEDAPAGARPEEKARPDGAVCPGCGKQNPSDARFCLECGSPLVPKAAAKTSDCLECGAPLKTGARFCIACGSAVQT